MIKIKLHNIIFFSLFLYLSLVIFDVDIVNSLVRRDYSAHVGKNLTIPCKSDSGAILWTRDEKNISSNLNVTKSKA